MHVVIFFLNNISSGGSFLVVCSLYHLLSLFMFFQVSFIYLFDLFYDNFCSFGSFLVSCSFAQLIFARFSFMCLYMDIFIVMVLYAYSIIFCMSYHVFFLFFFCHLFYFTFCLFGSFVMSCSFAHFIYALLLIMCSFFVFLFYYLVPTFHTISGSGKFPLSASSRSARSSQWSDGCSISPFLNL
jgi:hypothetical protein